MEVFLISLLTLFASFVGTLTGFGSSTIMLPIIVIFFPLPTSLLFVGIIHTFNDIWKVILFKHKPNWKVLLYFGIPGIISSAFGAYLVLIEPQIILVRVLGLFLSFYAIFHTLKPKLTLPINQFSNIGGGTLSGILAGVFGIGGPVRAIFLSSFNFSKEIYLFVSGATALFTDIPRLLVYYLGGTKLDTNLTKYLIIFIIISFIGAEIAKKFEEKISQRKFQMIVMFFLLIVGLKLTFY